MPDNRNLDKFMNDIKESDFAMEQDLKNKILQKTRRRIRGGWFGAKGIAAAAAITLAVLAFVPDTPVNALCQKLFAFIPGIGVVQTTEESEKIQGVLEKPVKVADGNQFIEVKTAYVTDKSLNISIRTNIGAVDAGEFKDPEEFKKFFAGETAPELYLSSETGKVKPNHTMWGGPSLETRVYAIDASFYLDEEELIKRAFTFEMEGFSKAVEISLSPVTGGTSPEGLGNAAVIDNIMILSNTTREGDVLEVLLSSVAPPEYKNIRFHLFDDEKAWFQSGIYMTDKDGTVYQPDDELRKKNDGSIDHFYFIIPPEKEGLKLVIPQILYSRSNPEQEFKIAMPKEGSDITINKELKLSGSSVVIEKASLIPSGNPMLPEAFKAYDCLRIDARTGEAQNAREVVLRVQPNVEIPDGLGYRMVSQATNFEFWGAEPRGYSFTEFDGMDKARKILLTFDVEYAMSGPWILDLQ